MQYVIRRMPVIILVIWTLCVCSCRVDTFSDIRNLEPQVSLVQVSGGSVRLTPDNTIINKEEQTVSKILGISYAGFNTNESFSATLELNLQEDVPEGYSAFASGECYVNDNKSAKSIKVEVPAGKASMPLAFSVTKAAIEKYAGKKMAARLSITGLSRYTLNQKADSVWLLMDMVEFGNRKIDVTATYIKNAVFVRAPGTTARFAPLADWIANDAVLNSRPTGAGFDANANKMGIERWSGGDNPIINGKIYQSFMLPAGAYQLEVQLATVKPDRDTYLVVAEGDGLPNDSQIATAMASKAITADHNAALLTLPFKLTTDKKVTAGFLLNFDQGVQKIVQAANIKMFRIESLFD